MAEPLLSAAAERIIALIEEQARYHVNLVRGVKKELLRLSEELKTIGNVLDDAENRGFKEKSVKQWLKKLERTSYEMEDVLDEWNYAILKIKMEHDDQSNDAAAVAAPDSKQKVCSFIPSSCFCFKKVAIRHEIAKKIQNVKEQLDRILEEKNRYNFVMSEPTTDPSPGSWRVQSTSLSHSEEIPGQNRERDIVVGKIVANIGRQEGLGMKIVSIVGVGGIGKTTLAQLVYNDSRVKECFQLRIWICVSDPFDVAGIAKGIIEGVGERSTPPNTNQLDVFFKYVIESISGKRFLLVLDDVWTQDYSKWEPLKSSLKCGGVGSTILVTTRNVKVAEMMGNTTENDIYPLRQLSDKDCWLLLRRVALCGRNEGGFEEVGEKIARKCNGLPLAAKVLGSHLRSKNTLEDWENVLSSEIWKLENAEVELFPHLLLSYNELSPTLKRCFSYCAVFPKDYEIDVEKLIENWVALGYLSSSDMEIRGREYFDILAMRSLFQNFRKTKQIIGCKMHDIVHDFAQFLRKDGSDGRVEAGLMKETTCQSCRPSLVSHTKEYRSLFRKEEYLSDLCDCLKSLRVLGIAQGEWQPLPQGIGNLIHLRWLDLSWNELSAEYAKIICNLYNLQFLWLNSCSLYQIPVEIGNLIHLTHLDLSYNNLMELPESICDLHELRTLNVDFCRELSKLPEGIHKLINLRNLPNNHTALDQYPRGLAQLTGLCRLTEFCAKSGRNDLALLKNLNCLGGYLRFRIQLNDDSEDMVEDAREAELKKKTHIQSLEIRVVDKIDEKKESSQVRVDVLDALEPHPNLGSLVIWSYTGSKLPDWVSSPLNQLRCIKLFLFYHMPLLPPLGKLPCLEEFEISEMEGLQFVGREFLGITTVGDVDTQSSSNTNIVAFPKLKTLSFYYCYFWEEWEDITAEEEESAALSIMPCLTELHILYCDGLTALPHRLLRKASSLELLDISASELLGQIYEENEEGSAWKSVSQKNPRLKLIK